MLTVLALSATAGVSEHGRKLSQTLIGKYSPLTDVNDHANIDLDQKAVDAMPKVPTTSDFAAAKDAFTKGGHSKPHATCTLTSVASAVNVGDKVTYTGMDGSSYTGTATNSITNVSASATQDFDVKLVPVEDAVGSRVETSSPLATAGGLTIGSCTSVSYFGGRTLQGFSTAAKKKMFDPTLTSPDCPKPDPSKDYKQGCPYTSYVPYWNYYCKSSSSSCNTYGDYANQQVLAAFAGSGKTGTDNFNIDFDGATAKDPTFRKDFAKKTSAYSAALMYAIREFEDAIDDCTVGDLTNNPASKYNGRADVHAWDEGVAFYVGGQIKAKDFYATDGKEQAPPSKSLAYTLGNKRCVNFKTCGRTGDAVTGEAYINYQLWQLFATGRDEILSGNCGGAVPIKNKIVQMTTVPLVQGTLRYAYMCRNGQTSTAKAIGELAAFAAAVLPQVHACSADHSATIAKAADPANYACSSSTSCTTTSNDFAAVKGAFEACYPDMGLTCALVGGIYDANKNPPAYDVAPCSDGSTSGLETGALIGIIVASVVAALLLLCLVFVFCRERSGKPVFVPMGVNPKASA